MASDRHEKLRNRVVIAAEAALSHDQYISALDALTGTGMLTRAHLESWRKGRIGFLERVIQGNLRFQQEWRSRHREELSHALPCARAFRAQKGANRREAEPIRAAGSWRRNGRCVCRAPKWTIWNFCRRAIPRLRGGPRNTAHAAQSWCASAGLAGVMSGREFWRRCRATRESQNCGRRAKAEDRELVVRMTAEIGKLFPGCPPREAAAIAAHTAARNSGRVGRTAAGSTPYDELLMSGVDRDLARNRVAERQARRGYRSVSMLRD